MSNKIRGFLSYQDAKELYEDWKEYFSDSSSPKQLDLESFVVDIEPCINNNPYSIDLNSLNKEEFKKISFSTNVDGDIIIKLKTK